MLYTVYRNYVITNVQLPFDSFLYFNDSWGASRGEIWRITLDIFRNSNFINKIFGYGVHGFAHSYHAYCVLNSEISAIELPYYDAHNMYLHFLIEYGLFGLVSAVSLFIYRVKAMLNYSNEDRFNSIKAIALITAMVNALFLFCNNINMAFIPLLL